MPSNRSLRPEQEQERRVQLSIRLPRWLVGWLKDQENQSKVIEQSLIKSFNLERKRTMKTFEYLRYTLGYENGPGGRALVVFPNDFPTPELWVDIDGNETGRLSVIEPQQKEEMQAVIEEFITGPFTVERSNGKGVASDWYGYKKVDTLAQALAACDELVESEGWNARRRITKGDEIILNHYDI